MNKTDTEVSNEARHPRRWTILAIMCTCLILVVAGVSSLNLAIPSIIENLQPTSTETLWIVDGYALVFAGLLLPAGATGDRYGRRGALLSGLVIFAVGAVLSSLADDPTVLIVTRSSMGIGAALIMPATLSTLIAVFPRDERSKAIAIWTGFAGAGGAIGIIGGGAILEKFWWGSVFFINVPIALLAIALIVAFVPTSRDVEQRPLDPIGSILSILGLSALIIGIIEGGETGWLHAETLSWFLSAIALLSAFVFYELRTDNPMLDPRLFRNLPFSLSSFTITATFAVMFGMFFIITQYFQFVQGLSPLEAGIRNLPFALSMVAVSPRSPSLAAKLGHRGTIILGFGMQSIGFVVLAMLQANTPYITTAIGLVLVASGMSILMPTASEVIVSSLPANKAGVGSAVNDTTREVGGSVGLAAMGTFLASGYRSKISGFTENLPPELAEIAADSIGGAFRVAQQTNNPSILDPARDAFVNGMSSAFWIAAGVGLASALVIAAKYPSKDTGSTPTNDDNEVELVG